MHVLSDAKWSWRCPEPFPAVELRYTNMQNVPSGQDGWHKSYIVYAGYRYYTGKWLKGAGRQLNGTFYGCVMYLCHTETELLMCIAEQKELADDAVYAVQVVPTFLTTKLTRRESTTGKNVLAVHMKIDHSIPPSPLLFSSASCMNIIKIRITSR